MIETMKNLEGVKAFFSKRHEGHSQGRYSTLNVGFHVDDDEKNVIKNHELIKEYISKRADIIYMNQIHSNNVCITGNVQNIPTCDSLLTHEKEKILMVMVADCIPILFFDKGKKVIAAIHAGRKGTFLNIVEETLDLMSDTYGSKNEDIYVSIGPHIHDCCYQVGDEIIDEAKEIGLDDAIKIEEDGNYLNMQKIVVQQLQQYGVIKQNIEIVDLCTSCNIDQFFSYRKEGQTGRFCGVIMLE